MAFKVSTGLRNHMLASGSFKGAMDGCLLKLYAGAVPESADADLGAATLLVTISVSASGTGLSFSATPANGVLSKAAGEPWQGVVANSGTAAFFRLETAADTGGASATEHRVQGSVGMVAADLNLSNTSLLATAVQTINHFNVALPSL